MDDDNLQLPADLIVDAGGVSARYVYLTAITNLISTYTGTATLESTGYSEVVTDNDLDNAGERQWSVYPARTTVVTVDDEVAFLTHMDEYYNLVRTEIENLLASQPVVSRIVVERWHLHFSTGPVDF